jgi:hypothetical protein
MSIPLTDSSLGPDVSYHCLPNRTTPAQPQYPWSKIEWLAGGPTSPLYLHFTGSYVVVWQRASNGVWYYVTDIFDSR